MDKVDKYLGEAKKISTVVKVIDKKTGNTITTLDAQQFLKVMEENFKTFKFVQDAVDFYNKQYKNHYATHEIEMGR